MNVRATITPLIDVSQHTSIVSAECEAILKKAGVKFEGCCGQIYVVAPGMGCRPMTHDLLAELLEQHASFGTCNWEAKPAPFIAISVIMSRVIATCMRQA